MFYKTGRSISVVQVLWEHLGWVRLPAARQGRKKQIDLLLMGGERLFVICEADRKAPADVIGKSLTAHHPDAPVVKWI